MIAWMSSIFIPSEVSGVAPGVSAPSFLAMRP